MGRSKKNKRKNPNQMKPNKRRKRERFWIEDCRETKSKEETDTVIDVLVTRVELEDDYTQVPAIKGDAICNNRAEIVQAPDGQNMKKLPGDSSSQQDPENELTNHVDSFPEESSDRQIDQLESQTKTDSKLPTCASETPDPNIQLNPSHLQAQDNSTMKFATTGLFVRIKKANSAKGPIKRVIEGVKDFRPLPDGDCGDGILNPYPKTEVQDKYWSQRRRFFSRFDEGIQLDKESWYSVTPEAIATHHSKMLVGAKEGIVIFDAFCGCGGNAIGFAKNPKVKLVVGIDLDANKLEKTANNAKIYGVPPEKLLLIQGDAIGIIDSYRAGILDVARVIAKQPVVPDAPEKSYRIGDTSMLPTLVDAFFFSPPWGGSGYTQVGNKGYSLSNIQISTTDSHKRVNGFELLEKAVQSAGIKPIIFFLPKNINGLELAKDVHKAGCTGPLVMEQNYLNGKLKAVTAYVQLGAI